MNADEVTTLRRFHEEDLVEMQDRLRRLLASCTHLRADGSSAAEPITTERGCCAACGVVVETAARVAGRGR